jgi:hypothetical protein
MLPMRWIAAATLSAAVFSGPAVEAGLFDRLRSRLEERSERSAESETTRIASADGQIGKVVSPVSYQPLAAPGDRLVPVPEPAFGGPTLAPGETFYPPTPAFPSPPIGPPTPIGPPSTFGAGPSGLFPSAGAPIVDPTSPFAPGPWEGMPLFTRVKYKDNPKNVHPCAVPIVVQVLDPCTPKKGGSCCGPQYVYVQICVPPNECPDIKVSKNGRKVKYKFDGYQVEVESKDGYVQVDYDRCLLSRLFGR